jgi:hypothetical protein
MVRASLGDAGELLGRGVKEGVDALPDPLDGAKVWMELLRGQAGNVEDDPAQPAVRVRADLEAQGVGEA